MDRLGECLAKAGMIREKMAGEGAAAVIIRSQSNFSWITAGGRGFIGLASVMACAAVAVTPGKVYLIADNIEAPRLLGEEIPAGFAEPLVYPWDNPHGANGVIEKYIGAHVTDAAYEPWFVKKRTVLCEGEIRRYRAAGRDCARALESSCSSLERGMSEFEAAGAVASGLWSVGLEPITVLIAGEERAKKYRHFLPAGKPSGGGFIVSVCTRRGGLVVSATRTVAFDDGFASDYDRLLEVERAAFDATVPGNRMSDVFKRMCGAYDRAGLTGEYENHHQGGLTGYLAREVKAGASCGQVIALNQAFAWNPSAVGVKCEDTVIVTESGLEIITPSCEGWPMAECGGRKRPAVLRK